MVRAKSQSTGTPKVPNLEKLIMLPADRWICEGYIIFTKTGKRKTQYICSHATKTRISSFCRVDCPAAQLHIDMTYKCGPFYVTILSMPNPMFVYKETHKHPSVFVGMTTTSGNEYDDYQFLASSIKRFGQIKSLIYGTDGKQGCPGTGYGRCLSHR